MTPVESNDEPIDPAWDNFGIRRTDFRSHCDGDYVNIFTSVEPQGSAQATAELMQDCARKLAAWILANKERFGVADRFLIIIGWSESVRRTNRQVIRTGGTYEDLENIAYGETPLLFRKCWCSGVFEPPNREPQR